MRTRSTSSCLSIDDWGGLTSTLKAAAACEVFQIGVGIHFTGETGIGTTLNLHVAASSPQRCSTVDSYYHHQTVDMITGAGFGTSTAPWRFPTARGSASKSMATSSATSRLSTRRAHGPSSIPRVA